MDSGPAEWWQVASVWKPVFVLLGAVLAAIVGWRTLKQRTLADALALEQQRTADGRAEWWRRTQWALDHALAKAPSTRALGLVALATLAESELAPVEELKMLDNMLRIVAESSLGASLGQDLGNGNMRDVEVMPVPTAASQAGKTAVEEHVAPSDAAHPAQPTAGGGPPRPFPRNARWGLPQPGSAWP